MKMVSAAKFGRAERELRPARVYGAGASGIYVRYSVEFSNVMSIIRNHEGVDEYNCEYIVHVLFLVRIPVLMVIHSCSQV